MFSIQKFFNRMVRMAPDTKKGVGTVAKKVELTQQADEFIKTAVKAKSEIKQQPPFKVIKNALKLTQEGRAKAGINTFIDTENNIFSSLYHQALKAGCNTKEAIENAKITTLATGHYSTHPAWMSFDVFAKNKMV